MTCAGCAGAVNRILKKIEGVQEIEADVATKTVVVTHEEKVGADVMLAALKKWGDASGKSVELKA
jgi:copper chaperone